MFGLVFALLIQKHLELFESSEQQALRDNELGWDTRR
jgi:hypothetical protein